ncbi:alpha/beta hydrolase [Chryseobacterium suipulveris]|uniref:Alpha/beta hydrolase n=1 Tax=Chryseobacterium suipulveris TaxID=2929800 RepID=A0ABY4BX26_9FLAO|nr:alpha/beta hydrolase [Chryseobacterium suipulveris]UOE42268.1 alpha/beta hydrolase [Chryseobacterium suipulveris]
MKLYVVSGLGADFKVLEKLKFPENMEVVFLDWLIPENHESFGHYIKKMADRIDDSEPFSLLGYSFGGVIVQEIDKIKPAEKVVILGSIKSDSEKSRFIKAGEISGIPKFLPVSFFNEKSTVAYSFLRKVIDPKNPKLMEYFTVRDPYYLKWSIEKMAGWKSQENPKVIQILADRDIVFPPKYSKPDYVIKNGTHLFPVTKAKEVSKILSEIFM